MHEILNEVPADGPETTTFDEEYRRRLFRWGAEQVKGEFAPKTWQAFWRTAVETTPVSVVARDLGLTAGAVYVARSRVLSRLRQRIEELGDETAARIGEE